MIIFNTFSGERGTQKAHENHNVVLPAFLNNLESKCMVCNCNPCIAPLPLSFIWGVISF